MSLVNLDVNWALNGSVVMWPSDWLSLIGAHDRNKCPSVGFRDCFPLWHHSQNLGCHCPWQTCMSALLQFRVVLVLLRHPNFSLLSTPVLTVSFMGGNSTACSRLIVCAAIFMSLLYWSSCRPCNVVFIGAVLIGIPIDSLSVCGLRLCVPYSLPWHGFFVTGSSSSLVWQSMRSLCRPFMWSLSSMQASNCLAGSSFFFVFIGMQPNHSSCGHRHEADPFFKPTASRPKLIIDRTDCCWMLLFSCCSLEGKLLVMLQSLALFDHTVASYLVELGIFH